MLDNITKTRALRHLAEGSILAFLFLVGLFIISSPTPFVSAENTPAAGPSSLSLFVNDRTATASTNSASGYILLSDTEQLDSSSRPATSTRPLSPSRTGKTTTVTLLPSKVERNH